MDLFLRLATLGVLGVWQLYWKITARKAYKEKPRVSYKKDLVDFYLSNIVVGSLFFVQFLGVQILPMTTSFSLSSLGFVIVLLGVAISVSGRIALGTNWANAHEYQIKQKQTLVTTGIYHYIRHPIYTGLLFVAIGVELVFRSYLFILAFVCGFVWAYTRGKREEKILEEHFGKEYRDYKKRTKMLIPFVW
jgi:protein-S-isoprenylcysteine O-methyltransferase Ste14